MILWVFLKYQSTAGPMVSAESAVYKDFASAQAAEAQIRAAFAGQNVQVTTLITPEKA